jgi:hypothetical protein
MHKDGNASQNRCSVIDSSSTLPARHTIHTTNQIRLPLSGIAVASLLGVRVIQSGSDEK